MKRKLSLGLTSQDVPPLSPSNLNDLSALPKSAIPKFLELHYSKMSTSGDFIHCKSGENEDFEIDVESEDWCHAPVNQNQVITTRISDSSHLTASIKSASRRSFEDTSNDAMSRQSTPICSFDSTGSFKEPYRPVPKLEPINYSSAIAQQRMVASCLLEANTAAKKRRNDL